MRFQREHREAPDVNLTPLIDVVFLLLIFFMVSTTFERETKVSVELPEASGERLETEPQLLEITIDREGRYYVNGQEVVNTQVDTLKRSLQKALDAGGETQQVILSADRKTPHEAVIRAMDAARQVGLVQMTFATSQPENP